jgi:hypothetical protein
MTEPQIVRVHDNGPLVLRKFPERDAFQSSLACTRLSGEEHCPRPLLGLGVAQAIVKYLREDPLMLVRR